ncbi:zinc ribbon-containing protein [Vibrio profundum]|uniref:zinc ribbon-containing protein n=1 Tax=Vibrio profundum TaxID=2910247 RepID=UPI003D0BCD14
MPKHEKGYEQRFQEIVDTLKHSPDELANVLENSGRWVHAANDLTKDELALISAYVKYDLKEFSDNYADRKNGHFYLMIRDSIWQGLLDITDRTRVEWVELFADLEHQGLYHAGDVIGLGVLVCEHCGHKTEYIHPTKIIPCIQCGKSEFSRQLLKP